MTHLNCNSMARIIQRMDLYNGVDLFPPLGAVGYDNPTLQNLDTSLIALLKGNDECGKVNNFAYSEDETVEVYRDDMEMDRITDHDLSFYDGLSANVETNAQVSEPTVTETLQSSEPTVTETLLNS